MNRINADFGEREVVHSDTIEWIPSPMAGVDRRPLDRVGNEVARATSIVRYAPGSAFSPHIHKGGEEFLVLDGVFSDEHGDFPAGSYIRNPPHSSHTPGSAPGCVILVKLWQFDPADRTHIRLRTDHMTPVKNADYEGVQTLPLYTDQREDVVLHLLAPGAALPLEAAGGAEVLVVQGAAVEGGDRLVKNSWLRSPVNTTLSLRAGEHGARLWVKTGHLRGVDQEIERLPMAA